MAYSRSIPSLVVASGGLLLVLGLHVFGPTSGTLQSLGTKGVAPGSSESASGGPDVVAEGTILELVNSWLSVLGVFVLVDVITWEPNCMVDDKWADEASWGDDDTDCDVEIDVTDDVPVVVLV